MCKGAWSCVYVIDVETNLLMACHDAIQSLRHGLGVRASPFTKLRQCVNAFAAQM